MPSALHILSLFIFQNSLDRYYYNSYFTSEEIKKPNRKKVKETIITELMHGRTRNQTQTVIPEHMLITIILQHSTRG